VDIIKEDDLNNALKTNPAMPPENLAGEINLRNSLTETI
jgi:hypothetical protein